MKTIYIGAQKNTRNGGVKWKLYTFLFLFVVITGSILNFSGSMIVEKWINQNGAGATGYAFSVRDVDLSLGKGQVTLNDVKIFNPKTSTELLKAPHLKIQVNWSDLLMSQDKNVTVYADKVDLILSKDLTSEIERIKTTSEKQERDFYLDNLVGMIGKLNIIEQKEDKSRTVLELNDVNLKVKEVSTASINKKTEFSITSNIADGGKFNLTGKTSEENGRTPWSIQGSFKQVHGDIFNKIAGDKLPFSFNESSLNAQISAYSDHGKVSGEITPDIKRLILVDERQSIARALTNELTFTLPFTLKDDLAFQYAETYQKLKNYRKYPTTTETSEIAEAPVVQTVKTKKASSFWPF